MMNKHILELARQAGFRKLNSELYTSQLEFFPITKNIENFVELLSRDFIKYISDDALKRKDTTLTIDIVKKLIKERFGIER